MFSKKVFFKCIHFVLVFQLAIGTQLVFAGSAYAQVSSIDKLINLEKVDSPETRAAIESSMKISSAIEEGRIKDLPERIVDPFLMGNQTLTYAGRSFLLGDPERALPNVRVSNIALEIIEGRLNILGYQNGELVAAHIANDFGAVAVASDKEMAAVITKNGDVLILDMALVVEYAFKEPLPFFTTYVGSEKTAVFRGSENLEITFLTRGLRPFVDGEVDRIVNTNYNTLAEAPIIPMSVNNLPEYSAGDLVVIERNGDNRQLRAILNQDVVLDTLMQGHTIIAATGALYSLEGLKNTIGEKIESYLLVDTDRKLNEPIYEIFNLIEQRAEIGTQAQEVINQVNQDSDLVKKFLSAFDQKKLRLLVDRANKFEGQKTSERDTFNIEQWWASYEKTVGQVPVINEELKQRQEHASQQDVERIQADIDRIKLQSERGDFRSDYQAIIRSIVTGNTGFHEPDKKLLDVLREKSKPVFKYFSYGVGVGIAAWAGVQVAETFAPSIAHDFFLTVNAQWDAKASELLKDAEFRWASIRGTTYMMMLVAVTMLYGFYMVPVMKKVQSWVKPLTNGQSRVASFAKKFYGSIGSSVGKYEDLSVWRRIVTQATLPYTVLIKPFVNTLLEGLLKQPTVNVWKAGLNPFTKIKADTVAGQKLGLEEGQSTRLGFSGLLALNGLTGYGSPEQIEHEKELKQQALKIKVSEQKHAHSLAWMLAALVVSKEKDIDPATLLLLVNEGLSLEDLKLIYQNPTTKSLWEKTAKGLNFELLRLMNEGNSFDVEKLSAQELSDFYRAQHEVAEQVKSQGELKSIATNLHLEFKGMGTNAAKFWGNFAGKEYDFLRGNTANEYVAKQTSREFVQDHAMVVYLPVALGKRAQVTENLEAGRPDQIAHHPDYFLDTPPPHLADIGSNTMIHLIFAGPRRMLVMQKLKAVVEDNYNKLSSTQIFSKPRTEGFLSGSVNWALNILNFKENNLGSYYVKGFIKRFFTVQAAFTLSLLMRTTIGEQSFQTAWMAAWFFWWAAELYFAWPWMMIDVGNSREEERLGRKRVTHESVVAAMLEAYRLNDETKKVEAFNNLEELYKQNARVSRKPLVESVIEMERSVEDESNRGLRGRLLSSKHKRELEKALSSENASAVYAIIGRMHTAHTAKDTAELTSAKADLDKVITTSMTSEEVLALKRLYAKDFSDLSLHQPPLFNKENDRVATTITFFFGAVLTTVLGVNLGHASYDEANLTNANILKWAGYSLTFYTTVWLAGSKHMWNKHYTPAIEKIRTKLGKKGGSCKGLF